jgi:hypothetical protein
VQQVPNFVFVEDEHYISDYEYTRARTTLMLPQISRASNRGGTDAGVSILPCLPMCLGHSTRDNSWIETHLLPSFPVIPTKEGSFGRCEQPVEATFRSSPFLVYHVREIPPSSG